jgi:hypothetical protein
MPRPTGNPKEVDWSGENPGIALRESPDGDVTCLVSFFRVVVSPHGTGHAAFILTDASRTGAGDAVNACYTDNEPLARYLLSDFIAHFGAWKGNPNLDNLPFLPADSFTHSGDHLSAWTERVTGPNVDLSLTWRDFDPPFMVEFTDPAISATGRHEMFSLFVPSNNVEVVANGVRVRGVLGRREMAGKEISTAFLAFSETWVKA